MAYDTRLAAAAETVVKLAGELAEVQAQAEETERELDLSFDPTEGGVPDSLTLFMNELGRYPLLTAADEVEQTASQSDAALTPATAPMPND